MKIWTKIPLIIITLVLVLFPFLLSLQGLEWNISYLLFSAVVLLLFYEAINFGKQKRLTYTLLPFNRGIIILLLSFLISSILAPNFVSSLLSPLGLGIVLVLSIWYVLLSNILSIKKINILPWVVLITASLFSIFVILDNLSVFKLLNFKNFTNFTTNPYEFLSFLLPILIILGYYLYGLFKNNLKTPLPRQIILVTSFFVLLTASLLLLPWPSAKQNPTSNLPISSGWSISLDSLKQPKSAIAGYGVGNFPVAFNLNRPFGLNGSFSRSSNFFFQILTENGLLGFLAFLYLLFLAFKETKTILSLRWNPFSLSLRGVSGTNDEAISSNEIATAAYGDLAMTDKKNGRQDPSPLPFLGFWSTVLLMLVLPPNLTLLFYFFTFLGLMTTELHLGGVHSATSEVKNTPKTLDLANLENTIWIVSGTLIALIFLTVYFAGRAYSAENYFRNSLKAVAKNDKVANVYDSQLKAINQNPYLPIYHESLSQTLIFWANALTQKKDLTDQDKTSISQLIQQSIKEAQTAISLNPQDSSLWQNLGAIYKNLVPAVNGADSWAVSALSQAVALDPNNPQAHFSLAGMYIQTSQWENSQRQLEIAVALDPSFSNGFYNLAYVQKQQGRFQEALTSLSRVLQLLPANSSDFSNVFKEKTALENFAREATSSGSLKETAPISPISPLSPNNPSTSSAELSPKLSLPQTASPPAHFKP